MKIKLSPYISEKTPKNKWFIELEWMSGDADHYEKRSYAFKSEEGFIAAYVMANRLLEFAKNHYDILVDIEDHNYGTYGKCTYDLMKEAKRDDNTPKYNIEVLNAVKVLIGEYGSLNDMFEEILGDTPPVDITYNEHFAVLDSISDMYYYDNDGNKFKVIVE